jgi:nicotinamidase-related amidase
MIMSHAFICIDFINEIVGDSGKLAAKGYADFARRHGSFAAIASRQARTRAEGGHVIHVRLGFASQYQDHPARSRLLGGARSAGILRLGTESTEFEPTVAPQGDEIVITKSRMSPFCATPLAIVLRSLGIQSVLLGGAATDLAVESAARDAHDRDFEVTVAADCCIAASDDDHLRGLQTMAKFAAVLDHGVATGTQGQQA